MIMNIRRLEVQDAIYMLEWMHDSDVVRFMSNNFRDKSLDDCKSFILSSQDDIKNIHQAIVDANNVYMGTVSLKNIEYERKRAEFAITIRKCAMAQGYSRYGMQEILKMAFRDLKLDYVYWYVNKNNIRAIKFYDKMRYTRIDEDIVKALGIPYNKELVDKVYWYKTNS